MFSRQAKAPEVRWDLTDTDRGDLSRPFQARESLLSAHARLSLLRHSHPACRFHTINIPRPVSERIYTPPRREICLCCSCNDFTEYGCKFYQKQDPPLICINITGFSVHSTNLSLVNSAVLWVEAEEVYHCQEVYVEWNIVRADGEIEVYHATPQGDYYYSHYSEDYPENGLSLNTHCSYDYCDMSLWLSPTDMRYNGAQFTCTFSLPECGTNSITDPITVYIQGIQLL